MTRRRNYPVTSFDPWDVEITGRIGNLGASYVVSGLDGTTVTRPTTHNNPDGLDQACLGVYKVELNSAKHELVDAQAEILYPYTQSGTVYGASFESGSSVDQGNKELFLHVWETAFGYHVEPDNFEVAVRLLLRKKHGRSGKTS